MAVEVNVENFGVTPYDPMPVACGGAAAYNVPATTDGNAAAAICFWCKGLTIDARVRVARYAPGLNETWKVGLVQILRSSVMKARYETRILEWQQATLPCYDSTDDATIPWYTPVPNPGGPNISHGPITAVNEVFNLALSDYPTSNIDPYLNDPVGGIQWRPLTHYRKSNQFDVYLVLRKTLNNVHSDYYLRHLHWSTTVDVASLEPIKWKANKYNGTGYQGIEHSRSVSAVFRVVTAALHALPPEANGSANGHIQTAPVRDATDHWWAGDV